MMTDWSKVRFFEPWEFFGYADMMSPLLIYSLDALRKFVGRPIRINNAFRPGNGGTHGRGEAADIVITGLHVVDQFLMAERTRLFAGIGIYGFWNRPGLHLDIRQLQPHQHGPRWCRNAAGFYVPMTWKELRGL